MILNTEHHRRLDSAGTFRSREATPITVKNITYYKSTSYDGNNNIVYTINT